MPETSGYSILLSKLDVELVIRHGVALYALSLKYYGVGSIPDFMIRKI